MPSTLDRELDNVKAVGHGIVSVFSAAIMLAIVAVVLANGSTTAGLITSLFKLLGWLVSIVVAPVSGGSLTNVDSSTPAPAGDVTVGPITVAPGTSTPANPFGLGPGTLNPNLAPETIPATP